MNSPMLEIIRKSMNVPDFWFQRESKEIAEAVVRRRREIEAKRLKDAEKSRDAFWESLGGG